MKKINSLFAGLFLTASIFLTQQAIAQAPQSMSYQSVLRNSSNALVANTAVGIKISVLQGNLDGIAVYTETQTATTNANGLVSLQIGTGSPTIGTFSQIDWANGPYFIKTESDPTGGSNYSITGTQQLASVPYALYAAKSGGNAFETTAMDPTAIYNTNTGNVGIGTDDPHAKLDVNGSLKVHQDLDVGNNLTVYDNLTVFGVLNGMRVGNIGTTYGNTVFGAGAMEAMNNDSASAGALNVAVGKEALSFNTDGSNNNAIGSNALQNNTTGSENVALGNQSLYSNTSGSQNTAIGYAASSVGNLNNTTAIGANAIVDASNKIQLGNTDVTSVNTSGTYTGAGFKTPNGTSSQYLMADGSVSTGAAGPQGATGLPSGTTGQTLRYNGTDWVANSTLYNDGSTIGVGTSTPNAETSLDIATQLPVLFPSMTQTQINNIAAPVEGMVQFNTDAHKLQVYAMLTNNASILNEIYLGTDVNNEYCISQNGISPIDGQIIAVELLLKDQFSSPYPAIGMGGQGSFTVPSYGSFTWFTFALPNPIAVTAGNYWNINFCGFGVLDRAFATNSNYPNGSGCCFPGADDDLLFRVHIQPNPGSYGWQNMH